MFLRIEKLCLIFILAAVFSASGQDDGQDFGWSLKVEPGALKREEGKRRRAVRGQTASGESGEIRVDTQLVLSDILVQDKNGSPVSGLTTGDFEIEEDGRNQAIDVFAHGDSAVPRSIYLVIDHSLSQWQHIERSIGAAKLLVDSLRPTDRMAIISDDVEMITDLTADKQVLKDKLEALRLRCSGGKFGQSRQYSALYAALNERVSRNGTRNILIFQTDGDELAMLRGPQAPGRVQFGIEDIAAVAGRKGVTVYSVYTGARLADRTKRDRLEHARREISEQIRALSSFVPRERLPAGPSRLSEDYLASRAVRIIAEENAVASVAELTGGIAQSLEFPEQAAAVYERILADIGRRYVIGYYPPERLDKEIKEREVRIILKKKGTYRLIGGRTYTSY